MRNIDYKTVLPGAVAGLIVALIVIFPVFTTNAMTLTILIISGVWAISTMGFTLIMRTGQFSLAQAALMAVGGYACALLTVKLGMPFWPSFLMAGIVSGIVALLVGLVVLRVGGMYFTIITLALSESVRVIGLSWDSVTGGSNGLLTSPPPPIILGGFEINFAASTVPYYYFIVFLVVISALVFWQIDRSRLGGTLLGLAANPILAEHQGIHLMKYRVIAFTVAGVFTGFAGAYYVTFLSVINPMMLGTWQSVTIMIMSVVGGISSLVGGAIVGAFVLYTLGIYLARLPIYGIQPFIYGAAVVLVLLFLPKGTGLIDLWGKFWRKIFKEPQEAEIAEK